MYDMNDVAKNLMDQIDAKIAELHKQQNELAEKHKAVRDELQELYKKRRGCEYILGAIAGPASKAYVADVECGFIS